MQTDRLRAECVRKRNESERTIARHDALAGILDELSRTDADLRGRLERTKEELSRLSEDRAARLRHSEELRTAAAETAELRGALRARMEVLEGLEKGLEGFGAGVRAVWESLRSGEAHGDSILGLAAELLNVPREVAPLIDLALGDSAQKFVVRDEAALEQLLNSLGQLQGRVGFFTLNDSRSLEPAADEQSLKSAIPAASFVSVDRLDAADLPRRLLGRTFIVDDLNDAFQLAKSLRAPFRLITRAGEALDSDGSATVGPALAGSGILSRKSELRDLRGRVAGADARALTLERDQAESKARIGAASSSIRAFDSA